MRIFGIIPFIKLENDTRNDEKWDGELSHLCFSCAWAVLFSCPVLERLLVSISCLIWFDTNTCSAPHLEMSPKPFTMATIIIIALFSTTEQTHRALVVHCSCLLDWTPESLHTNPAARLFFWYFHSFVWKRWVTRKQQLKKRKKKKKINYFASRLIFHRF